MINVEEVKIAAQDFIRSCGAGRADKAKQLVERYGWFISHAGHYAMVKACENGRVQVVYWLTTLRGFGSRAQAHELLYIAAKNNRITIMKFLKENYEYDDLTIEMANEQRRFYANIRNTDVS